MIETSLPIALQSTASPHTSLVIPALNEVRNIGWVLRRLPASIGQVVVVDGRSTDGTVDEVLRVCPDADIVMEQRPGKGAALRAGFDAAEGRFVVMLDADGSMDPGEIGGFVSLLEQGFHLVKGSRFVREGGSLDITRLRNLGNRGLTATVNVLYRTRFSDLCYGYMAFDRDVLPSLDLAADGFEIETEIVVKAIRAGLQIAEVPSWEYARRSGESNLSTFRDGARVLRELVRGRISKTPLHGAPVSRSGDPDRLPEGASAARSIVRKLEVPSAH